MSPISRSSLPPRLALVFAMCGAGLIVSSPSVHAQKTAKTAAKPKAKTPLNAPAPLPILLLGAAVAGGLLLGAGLGWSLKKTPAAVAVEAGPGQAFDDVPFPLATVDRQEKITRVNAPFSAFMGETGGVGQRLSESLHPDDLTALRAGMQSVFDGERAEFGAPARLFGADGQLKQARIWIKKQGAARKPSSLIVGLDDITEQVAVHEDLDSAQQTVHSLYSVIGGDRARTLDTKMRALLAMGCGRLNLPIGVLCRLCDDTMGDRLETLFVQSPDRRVRPAMTFSRSQLGEGVPSIEAQLLGLADLPHAGVPADNSHVERNDDLAYIGAPVNVEGRVFGMLSFASLDARAEPFSARDVELLHLMAEWVGGEIERENARAALTEQQRELLAANGKLESLATHDGLTGIKNRRAFNEKLAEEWSRAQRYATPLTLVMFDIDQFKSYNDTFGHQAGDAVLKTVAQTVMGLIRTTDFLARYGGEEFALILPNTEAEGAYILAERLRECTEKTNWPERVVTASFGVASLEIGMSNGESLIEAADKALYKSKDRGRNRVTQAVAEFTSDEAATADAAT